MTDFSDGEQYSNYVQKLLATMDEKDISFAANFPSSMIVNYVLDNVASDEREKLTILFAENLLLQADLETIKHIVEENEITSVEQYTQYLRKSAGMH